MDRHWVIGSVKMVPHGAPSNTAVHIATFRTSVVSAAVHKHMRTVLELLALFAAASRLTHGTAFLHGRRASQPHAPLWRPEPAVEFACRFGIASTRVFVPSSVGNVEFRTKSTSCHVGQTTAIVVSRRAASHSLLSHDAQTLQRVVESVAQTHDPVSLGSCEASYSCLHLRRRHQAIMRQLKIAQECDGERK